MQYELSENDRHRIYLALLAEKWRTQEQMANGPKSSSDFDLEAHEALPDVLAHVERLLATFAPSK